MPTPDAADLQRQILDLNSYIRPSDEREYVLLEDVLALLRTADPEPPLPEFGSMPTLSAPQPITKTQIDMTYTAIPLNSIIDLLHRTDALLRRVFYLHSDIATVWEKDALATVNEIRALIPILDKARDSR